MNTRYTEIVEKFNRVREALRDLDKEYVDKQKGEVYQKRKLQLINKQESLKNSAKQIGTKGVVCHVRGKRSRPSLRNPSILIQESFNLYFTDITEEEASSLIKLHVKNVITYQVTFYKAGMIITSS